MFEMATAFGTRVAVWHLRRPERLPARVLVPGAGASPRQQAAWAGGAVATEPALVGATDLDTHAPGSRSTRGREREHPERRGHPAVMRRRIVLPGDPPPERMAQRQLGVFVPELAEVDDGVRGRWCDDTSEMAWAEAVFELGWWRQRLSRAEPGPDLASALVNRPDALAPVPGSADLTRDDTLWADAVLASIQARARLIAHLQAAQYADVAELSAHYPAAHEFLATEVGLALSCSEASAGSLVGAAESFRNRLPATLNALSDGLIDEARACAILAATAPVPDDVATAVEAKVLPGASTVTATTVRRRCERAIIAIDPRGATERHERRARERYVSRWAESDGMAGLRVYATAQDITTVWEALTGLADATKSPDDGRDLGNRRVDALVEICADVLAAGGWTGGALPPATSRGWPASTSRVHGARRTRPQIRVTMPLTALLGSDEPCELDGWGPITADQARIIATDATLTRLVCDPLSGTLLDHGRTRYEPPESLKEFVRARDRSCAMPICGQPADRCDIDHVIPAKPDPTTGLPTLGATADWNLGPDCRHHHLSKDGNGGFRQQRNLDGSYTWITPLGRSYRKEAERLWHPPPEGLRGQAEKTQEIPEHNGSRCPGASQSPPPGHGNGPPCGATGPPPF